MSNATRGVKVQLSPVQQAAVVQLQDRALNFYITDDLKALIRNAVEQAIDSGHRHIVLDFTNVEVMDSCGVELLIRIRENVVTRGGQLVLCGMRQTFARMLEMMRLGPYFRILQDATEALDAIVAPERI